MIDDPNMYILNETFGDGRFVYRPREHHKKAWRSVRRFVKKVVRSPIGKIALGAAAAFSGGAALGLWGAGAAGAAGAAATKGFTLSSVLSTGSKALQAIGAINTLTGAKKQQAVQEYGPQISAARRNELAALQNQQAEEKAVVQQQNQVADQREQELSSALAAQKNAIIARRRGRGGLSFTGPTTGLKETLGG